MALDPVPWLIGGGAEHSPEVARLLSYAATRGSEGIVEVGDLKVTTLATPGAGVRSAAGAGVIRNRGAGGQNQSYIARNASSTTINIAATAGTARSDLVVLQVEDPNVAGEPWQDPANPAVGPYVFFRVISNVPAGTKRLQDVAGYEGRSAITLARIDLPANTSAVQANHIIDLRKVANPRRETVLRVVTPPKDRQVQLSTSWHNWPTFANEFTVVEVPSWATRMDVVVTMSGIALKTGVWGGVRATIGSLIAEGSFDSTFSTSADPYQDVFTMAQTFAVPTAMRGTPVGIGTEARAASTGMPAANLPWTTATARAIVQIEFTEAAD